MGSKHWEKTIGGVKFSALIRAADVSVRFFIQGRERPIVLCSIEREQWEAILAAEAAACAPGTYCCPGAAILAAFIDLADDDAQQKLTEEVAMISAASGDLLPVRAEMKLNIEAALKTVNGRAVEHTFSTYAQIEKIAQIANSQIAALPAEVRAGATFEACSGSPVTAGARTRERQITEIALVHDGRRWMLSKIANGTAGSTIPAPALIVSWKADAALKKAGFKESGTYAIQEVREALKNIKWKGDRNGQNYWKDGQKKTSWGEAPEIKGGHAKASNSLAFDRGSEGEAGGIGSGSANVNSRLAAGAHRVRLILDVLDLNDFYKEMPGSIDDIKIKISQNSQKILDEAVRGKKPKHDSGAMIDAISLSLSETQLKKLEWLASKDGCTIQDWLRKQIG